MQRKQAHDRIGDIVEITTKIMMRKGYRRTQMADVTTALGLSPGAIYRYVESKEALFDLVMKASVFDDFAPEQLELPVATPAPGATLAFLKQAVNAAGGQGSLQAALAVDTPSDARAELAAIVNEIFVPLARYHRGLRILERSALEWPELSELWWGGLRQSIFEMLAIYLRRRAEQGLFHEFPDYEAAARLITEVNAYFAMHRHHDPNPTEMSDEDAKATALAAVLRAFVKE